MENIEISINPMAEFLEATDSRKKKIMAEQLDPDPVRIPYYQKARSTIKKCIILNGDLNIVADSELFIKNKVVVKKWQHHDKSSSLQALKLWSEMRLPDKIVNNKLTTITSKEKYLSLYGVKIKISPTAIFKIEIDG